MHPQNNNHKFCNKKICFVRTIVFSEKLQVIQTDTSTFLPSTNNLPHPCLSPSSW